MKDFILLFFLIINIKSLSDNASKAMSCMAIVNSQLGISEQNINEADSQLFSTTILKCFLEISLKQAKEIMNEIEKGNHPNFKSEKYKKLCDISDINKYGQSELAKASENLISAVEDFKNLQMGENDNYEYEDDDDYFGTSNEKGKNIFQWFFKAVWEIFEFCNVFERIAIIFIIGFFIFRIGLYFYNKSKEKKNKNADENKEEVKKNEEIKKDEKEESKDKESKKEEKNESNKEKKE